MAHWPSQKKWHNQSWRNDSRFWSSQENFRIRSGGERLVPNRIAILERRIDEYKGKIRNAEHELAEEQRKYHQRVEAMKRKTARRVELLNRKRK